MDKTRGMTEDIGHHVLVRYDISFMAGSHSQMDKRRLRLQVCSSLHLRLLTPLTIVTLSHSIFLTYGVSSLNQNSSCL